MLSNAPIYLLLASDIIYGGLATPLPSTSTTTTTSQATCQTIEDVAASIADPYGPRFRQHLTAQEALKLAKQLPPISFPSDNETSTGHSPATKRWPGPRAHPHGQDAALLKRREEEEEEEEEACGDNGLVTPSCVRHVYEVDYTPKPSRVTFAVYATEAATYNPDDLTGFLRQYRPEAQGAEYEVIGSGDPSNPANAAAQFEVALDTQTLLGTAWPAKGQLYDLGGVFGPKPGRPYKPFVDFLFGLIGNETVPTVVSFSESQPEDIMDPDYARTLCRIMALVGARGVSLLFSSGNNGPNGDTPDGEHKRVFETEFPASCPWVTAVGGTSNIANETAATGTTIPPFAQSFYAASGGGFSALFAAPSYQRDRVRDYVSQHVPPSYANVSGFNAHGRGVPDLAAFSTNVPVVVNNASLPIAGTSASTPLWAAVVALLNDNEMGRGRPPLGFLNPWLYSLRDSSSSSPSASSPAAAAAGLKDITTGGNNKGRCNALTGCNLTETLGYDVVPGWDPVTGLGSPVFSRLRAALDDCS